MISVSNSINRAALKGGVATLVLAVLATPVAALAQAATTTAAATTAADEIGTIVVTGTILKNADRGAIPLTTVTSEALDKRGIITIQDAIQTLPFNNGPALTNSFTANGAFAGGASAVSLRGLSTNSSLVLFDGLRASYYPLADDGSRNFVDLNTIPDDIVERIEVVRDGASSSYGADAIAGVVNIITKRQITGINGRIEGGITQRGDGDTHRIVLQGGYGDLATQGFNVYASGFYFKQEGIKANQRPGFYSTDNLTGLCNDGTCGPNNVVNGIQPSGAFTLGTAANFLIRPYDATNTTAQGRWQNLVNCPNPVALNAAQQGAANPATVCQFDYTNLYNNITPTIERFGGSANATVRMGDSMEGYIQFNFLQTTSSYYGNPAVFRGAAPTGIFFPQFSTADAAANRAPGSFILNLPVYVCPFTTIGTCNATNGKLNPQNPFAAQGNVARLIGRDQGNQTYNETRNRTYRAAFGIKGDITDTINFNVGGTAMHTDLRRTQAGYVYIQSLLDVIKDGSYNFANTAANSAALNAYLKPTNITNASSDLVQFQADVGAKVMDLPGGPLQVGVGTSIYYEAVDSPSANSDIKGPTQRYFTLNAFGTKGNRTVTAVYGEINAPVLDMLTVNASGRYDHYSTGQSNFSPKVSAKFTPVDMVLFRGSYSRGFRVPSFAEANALPTTGYVTNTSAVFNDTFLKQYGCTVATFNACPAYIRTGSYGQTTLASPNLDPEKSRNFGGGVVFTPARNISLSVDYYNIKKTGAITSLSNAPALIAYYAGQPIPAGYTVIADAPDVNFPNAKPRVGFVQSALINADTINTDGLDFNATGRFEFGEKWTFVTSLDASYILNLSTTFRDGSKERYDGTLGNFNLTAGSGTPKWRGTWVNSVTYDKTTVNLTTNYFDGYDLSAMDQGTGYKDCGLSDGSVPCRVKSMLTFDLSAQFRATDQFTFYFNVINLADRLPPYDPVTYGAHLYNPVQGGSAILGRSFRAGVKFNF